MNRNWIGVLAILGLSAACAPSPPAATPERTGEAASPGTGAPDTASAPTAQAPSPGTDTDAPPPQVEPTGEEQDELAAARQRMVEFGVEGHGVEDPQTLEAMRAVPRHHFVPVEYRERAYDNVPLPIGYGQTISQPFIVGLMTQELQLEPDDRVLEIGTGSGYQAAVLAEIGVEVYSVEIVEPLHHAAAERLTELGYGNIQLKLGDGYFGWEEHAPYDSIIVTAAPDHVPQPLLKQLKIDGILVIPVGPVGGFQELWRIVRADEDDYQSTSLGGVRFVPLVRETD